MINYPSRFNDARPAGFDGIFDWDFLKPAFAPTKIEPMDLDAIIERNGKFLIFETKSAGVPIPIGQQITLERLVAIGLFTVVLVWAKHAAGITGWDYWFMGKHGQVCKKHEQGDSDDLTSFVRRWFVWASGDVCPF